MSDINKLFEEYKHKKIALYGLGTESEKAIQNFEHDYNIIGLLDGFKESGELYGKPIISLSEAIEQGTELIIVVARPGSCKAIEKRIGDICRENEIALIDIRGKDLLIKNQITYDFSHISGVTKSELWESILQAEVISFDLFDTLIMRRVLSQEDIIRCVDCKLQEQGVYIEAFCSKRLGSEKDLSRSAAPTLMDIYADMLSKEDIDYNITSEQLAQMEWETDFRSIIPRKEVCALFQKAVHENKKVYVVSDTYYSKTQLSKILEKCSIDKYTDILSSSDYKTSKTQQLFEVFKNETKALSYLHIGDDIVADIEAASRHGIKTCKLHSGTELLDEVGNFGFSEDSDSLSDRIKQGLFVSKLFNSPFCFEEENKKIKITLSEDIGYLLMAPMLTDFIIWFRKVVTEHELSNIWFGARDGFLVKKMYRSFLESMEEKDNSGYFMTSRTAAIRAGMLTENDILYVDSMKFSGTVEECLKERFGLDACELENTAIDYAAGGLLKYKNAILNHAKLEQKKYKKYMDSLEVEEGPVAFFDFVAKGTTQMYLQRLLNNHLKGLYFLQLEPDYMKDKGLDILAFYAADEANDSVIFENYYILETILTAPHPSVKGFDENGEPVYSVETRKKEDIECFLRVQKGILDYFEEYLKVCPVSERKITKKLDETLLSFIHNIMITDKDFMNLVIEDPFFNRMTNITDVI